MYFLTQIHMNTKWPIKVVARYLNNVNTYSALHSDLRVLLSYIYK